MNAIASIDLPGFRKVRTGKVRELFDVGEFYLMVATDRISAFDCILPDPIPGKGKVLNQLSAFWFRKFADFPSHFVTDAVEEYPAKLKPFADQLRARSMLVRKAEPVPIECVVRGYLAGSSWLEYQQTGKVCGIELPPELELAAQLPGQIFTPARKAGSGHDENLSWEQCLEVVPEDRARQLRDLSMALYGDGSVHAAQRGIIIADTKFEFGLVDETLLLIDECLTPDSSRFWSADEYHVGVSPVSFDKQFVRDYLEELGWNKQPPAPNLAPEIIAQTSIKYQEALERLTKG